MPKSNAPFGVSDYPQQCFHPRQIHWRDWDHYGSLLFSTKADRVFSKSIVRLS